MELLESGPSPEHAAPPRRSVLLLCAASFAAGVLVATSWPDRPTEPTPAAQRDGASATGTDPIDLTARGRPVDLRGGRNGTGQPISPYSPVRDADVVDALGARGAEDARGVVTYRVTLDNRGAEPLTLKRVRVLDRDVTLLNRAPPNDRAIPVGGAAVVVLRVLVDCSTLHGSPPTLAVTVGDPAGKQAELDLRVDEDDPQFFAAVQDACASP